MFIVRPRGGIHPRGSGVDSQPRVAAPHHQGQALRCTSLAHRPCPDPGLPDVQVHFPQPETWSDGPGEVRLHRIEHGTIVMALEPSAVKRPTFPLSPAELIVIPSGSRNRPARGPAIRERDAGGQGQVLWLLPHGTAGSTPPRSHWRGLPAFSSMHG